MESGERLHERCALRPGPAAEKRLEFRRIKDEMSRHHIHPTTGDALQRASCRVVCTPPPVENSIEGECAGIGWQMLIGRDVYLTSTTAHQLSHSF